MGLRGPAPAPTIIKKMRGNPGRRPLNQNEPQPPKGAPTCPQWLDKVGRAEWHRVVPILDGLGLLTKADRAGLALYCDAWSQLLAARLVIKEKGLSYTTDAGYVAQRPEVRIYSNLQGIIKGWCHEFGLTPSARGRMTAPGKEEEADSLEMFLNGNRN